MTSNLWPVYTTDQSQLLYTLCLYYKVYNPTHVTKYILLVGSVMLKWSINDIVSVNMWLCIIMVEFAITTIPSKGFFSGWQTRYKQSITCFNKAQLGIWLIQLSLNTLIIQNTSIISDCHKQLFHVWNYIRTNNLVNLTQYS